MNTFSLGIDSNTYAKFIIEKSAISKIMLEQVHFEQLEYKYGGN